MFNNINMKKKLIIVLISIMLLTGCAKKVGNKDYHIVEKNLKIDDNCEVLYPTIDEIIDESLRENIVKTTKKIKENKKVYPDITYQSFLSKPYISYLINYQYQDKKIIKGYIYNLNTKGAVYVKKDEILKILNSYENNAFRIKESDLGFLTYIINQDKLEIYLSEYLNAHNNKIVIPLDEQRLLIDESTQKREEEKKLVAITFDDAPSVKTKEIVDLLEQLGVKATFFILGCNAEIYKNELLYIDANDHEIGNHSYSHPNFKKITLEEGLKEITTTQEIIFNITNHYPRVFRFPYGAVNKSVLKEINIPTVLWDVDSLDWQDHTTASIVKKVKGSVRKNSILLFHDFKYYNKEAITIVIKDLQKEGYTFVSVSKLLKFASEEDIKTGIIHFNG